MWSITTRGWAAWTAGQSMPQRSRALGRLPTMSTSLTSSSRWNKAWPSAWRRSSVTQRLLRLTLFHTTPMPSLRSPHVRMGSPAPGGSTLITSAPNSPSAVPTIGPAASVAASMTRSPSSGRGPSAMGGDRGAGQAEVVAQGRARVCGAEQAPALELGHHHADDVLVGAGHVGGGDDEAVAGVAGEPLLHLVGHLAAGADEPGALEQRGPVAGRRFWTRPRMPDTDSTSSSVMGASRARPEKS